MEYLGIDKKPRFLNHSIIPIASVEEMEQRMKFMYTTPRQLPLFEEEKDGNLTQYCEES